MDAVKKRRGRPVKAPVEGDRIPLSLRVTADLKRKLEQSAGGRSLSQEAEYRLERSFLDDELFSSPEIRFWAILLAAEFHKAGAAAAASAELDTADRAWMKDPSSLLSASYQAMSALVRDLVRQPGADLDAIMLYVDQLKNRVTMEAVHAGRARIVDKAGKPAMGFLEREEGE
jgi:hypothetical protein